MQKSVKYVQYNRFSSGQYGCIVISRLLVSAGGGAGFKEGGGAVRGRAGNFIGILLEGRGWY